jgi:hypothetical protein
MTQAVQILGTWGMWQMSKFWGGPRQELGLQAGGVNNDLRLYIPKIAQDYVERATGEKVPFGDTLAQRVQEVSQQRVADGEEMFDPATQKALNSMFKEQSKAQVEELIKPLMQSEINTLTKERAGADEERQGAIDTQIAQARADIEHLTRETGDGSEWRQMSHEHQGLVIKVLTATSEEDRMAVSTMVANDKWDHSWMADCAAHYVQKVGKPAQVFGLLSSNGIQVIQGTLNTVDAFRDAPLPAWVRTTAYGLWFVGFLYCNQVGGGPLVGEKMNTKNDLKALETVPTGARAFGWTLKKAGMASLVSFREPARQIRAWHAEYQARQMLRTTGNNMQLEE